MTSGSTIGNLNILNSFPYLSFNKLFLIATWLSLLVSYFCRPLVHPFHLFHTFHSICLSYSLFLIILSSRLALLPTGCPLALFVPFFLRVTFRQHKTESNTSGLSWINKSRGLTINMKIYKVLMGSWEGNPIHSYSRLSGVFYACLYLCICWWRQ